MSMGYRLLEDLLTMALIIDGVLIIGFIGLFRTANTHICTQVIDCWVLVTTFYYILSLSGLIRNVQEKN